MSVHFERNQRLADCVSGTHLSVKGMQPMTSTGVHSFDRILGGGLPLNSVTIIEEDTFCQFSTLLAKCFVADSLETKHKTMICSENISSKKSRFLRELPVRTVPKMKPMDSNSEDIRIAWRYKSSPSVDTVWTNESHFDFGQHIDEQSLESSDIIFSSHNKCLEDIESIANKNSNIVTRILIDGLGSPLSPLPIESLPQFTYKLKSLVRKLPNIVCLVTINSNLIIQSNHSYVRSRVHNIVDGVIKLIAFDEKTLTPYTEYEGLFVLIKIPKLNSFNYYSIPDTLDLGFQLKNNSRFLIIDKLCLPPDLSETVSRTTGSAVNVHNKSLEF